MMNGINNNLRRALFLVLFGSISLVAGMGFLSSGCDKKAPTTYQDIDSAATIIEPPDTVDWDQDSVYVLQIETTENTLQGMHVIVGVVLKRAPHQLAGFDFMFGYDASALNFQAAIPGAAHTKCGWEYFNYRFGPNGNCGNECPSGMLEVVSIAETNNGPNHPDMVCTDSLAAHEPDTLFGMDFLVSNDRTLECQFAPIRFFWTNCTDNSVAYHPSYDPLSAVQGVSRHVFEDAGLTTQMSDGQTGFPTYTGTQDVCMTGGGLNKPVPIRIVDFINGGVDIICADSIDARGDINLNGNSYEIADAVLFRNYFVRGIGVFNINYQGQVAASDVNGNGVLLEVADLVYLIRKVTGDANPYPNATPVPGSLTYSSGILSISTKAAAAYIVAEGNVNPTLLATQLDMDYAFDGRNTHILISKIDRVGFEGDFIQFDGRVVSAECATYDGRPISFDGTVVRLVLEVTNHPNPFRDTTVITYTVPPWISSRCSIFNAAGRKVAQFINDGEPRAVAVEWDASDQPEGIYVCRVEAGEVVATHRMVKLGE